MNSRDFKSLQLVVGDLNRVANSLETVDKELRKDNISQEQLEAGMYYLYEYLESAGKQINAMVLYYCKNNNKKPRHKKK